MTQHEYSPNRAAQQAKATARQASPWIEPLGRFGYAAKGIVYAIIGVLAARAAFGAGGETTDTRGALRQIIEAPYGQVLLALVGVGLVGYAVWRFVQALLDTENKGSDAKGYLVRVAYAVIGIVYLGLAFSAVRLILGTGGGGNAEETQRGIITRVLEQPFGQWLLALAGVAVSGIALHQLYKGITASFRDELNLAQMSPTEERWAVRSGRFGFMARGVVFAVIGVLLVVAAWQSDASEARGFEGALTALGDYGPWVLGLVALGLIAYGLYCLVEARYRRMVMT